MLRRLLCGMVMICLFASCSSLSVSPVTNGFRCRVETNCNGIAVVAQLDRTDPAKTTLTFMQPSELEGLTMVYDYQTVYLELFGATMDIPSEYMSHSAVIRAVADAFEGVEIGNGTATADGLLFDEESGLPLSLEIADPSMTIKFSEWQLPDR